MIVTKHGKRRIKQRTGVGKSDTKIKKAAKRAFERGYRHADTKGSLNKYITHLYLNSGTYPNNIRIYDSKVWIFKDHNLITVFDLPSKYILHLKDYIKTSVEEDKNP